MKEVQDEKKSFLSLKLDNRKHSGISLEFFFFTTLRTNALVCF